MNFPLITIPTPVAVAAWIDQQMPATNPSRVSYSASGYYATYWHDLSDCLVAKGATPDDLLADLCRQVAEHDPIAKLRKDAEALGFALVANNPAQPPH